jgi:hypothetical protein
MADCIDWQIIDRFIELLQSCTYANGYNTDVELVELIHAEVEPAKSRRILVCPNESDPEQEYLKREDVLPFVLIYSDGLNESDGVSYIERYKNVAADIQKCIKTNPSLYSATDGVSVCQNIEIPNIGYTVLEADTFTEEIVYMNVNVYRTIDNNNPYQTA